MNLRQILEARAISRDTRTVYYSEYYPHYMGTLRDDGQMKISDLDELVHQINRDGYNDDTEDFDDSLGMKQYAFSDIVHEWPSIRNELIKKGYWVGDWEEGSHSASLNSADEAQEALKNYEMKHHGRDDWNEDDWE